MYERMLNQAEVPALTEMTAYCGENAALFTRLNQWLCELGGTGQQVVFPYGKHYGWGISHKRKKKLICNVFPEEGAFTVMLHLSNMQFASVYDGLRPDTKRLIDEKYPCGDGGWIHYRVASQTDYEDIEKLLAAKCA